MQSVNLRQRVGKARLDRIFGDAGVETNAGTPERIAKGLRRNEFTFSGVQAPACQGAKVQAYREYGELSQRR
jgi:hypothetical protein